MNQDDVTVMLRAWSNGDTGAQNALFDAVYSELRDCAARYLMRERRDHTLQPTALVHEAYLRLIDQSHCDWQSRAHFIALAASMMRRILVDHARGRAAQKRGGNWEQLSIDLAEIHEMQEPSDLLALNAAVEELGAIDAFQAKLVDLRFFGGLSIQETATVMNSSPATVKREWAMARAWLFRRLQAERAE
jgi:RNA polymerase sigma factor (TIGR02999 family)